jgi:copper transport protein
VLLAIGAFAFAATSLIGTETEVRRTVQWVRRGAVLVLAGTLVEVVGMSLLLADSIFDAMSPSSLIDLLDGQFGVAVLLRLIGAIAMLQDPRLVTVSLGPPVADAARLPGALALARAPSSAAATTTLPPARTHRLEVQHEWVAMMGMAAVVASFMFVGHRVTADAGAIARASTLVHVVAAGVWFGGVVVMANTLTGRWRNSAPLDAAPMAIRFSRIAAASLVLVALAGLVLTWAIIETPSDLISSAWGRVLLLKVALVGIAAALGAYNHFRVVPQLGPGSAASDAADTLRRVVRVEAVVLLLVVAVTAILVAAAI